MKIRWKYLLRAAMAGGMLLGWAGGSVAVAGPVVLVTEPSGEHKLRVTIGDVEGGVSRKVFQVKIL